MRVFFPENRSSVRRPKRSKSVSGSAKRALEAAPNASRILVVALAAVVVALALPSHASAGYNWPVKPFHQEHPVRGQLNDPRMSGPTFDASDTHTFHPGVDIVAPDGTAVYAVEPGYVYYIDPTAIAVRGRKGVAIFGYWHILPVVKNHTRVKLHALLGYIEFGRWHVHFSEKRKGRYVNPLRCNGLRPYIDKTPPTINSISVYDGAYRDLADATVSGSVKVTVNAFDTPQLASNWAWAVVTPAWIGWQLIDAGGKTIRAGHWDFRNRLCTLNPIDVLAPGTLKNGSQGAGSYNYWIGGKWDTTLIPNGTYQLAVTATDISGNTTTKSINFGVANDPAIGNPS